ncbi:MAG: VCBS repeat-containing protein [Nitrospirae bacterium]|nr:VCBS repeat-containing protein [Nitrospirota bacterium]
MGFQYLPLFLLLVFSGCSSQRTIEPSPYQNNFSPDATYHVGLNPNFLLTADLNRDGLPDLITSNTNSNNISVLLGKQDGSFKEHVMFPVGKRPRGIAIGDFNGDKIPDIAVSNNETDDLTILIGKGDGTFIEGEPIKLDQRSPLFVSAGDFNQDGRVDLLILSRFDHLILYLGNGDGTFKFYKTFNADDTPTALVMGDFNRDQKTDLAVTNNGPMKSGLEIFLGDGQGNFTPGFKYEAKNYRPLALTVTDLNNDGIPDLMTVDAIHHNVTLFIGNGDGSFKAMEPMSGDSEPISILTDDFNRDHMMDIAFINYASSTLAMYYGNGNGTFKMPPARYQTKRGPFSMVKGDFNHDGTTDLAIANHGDSSVTIFLGKPPR